MQPKQAAWRMHTHTVRTKDSFLSCLLCSRRPSSLSGVRVLLTMLQGQSVSYSISSNGNRVASQLSQSVCGKVLTGDGGDKNNSS